MNTSFKYRMKVKARDLCVLTNAGYVVSQKDCAEGEFWLHTNSPSYLEMYVELDGFEVVSPIEEIPQT